MPQAAPANLARPNPAVGTSRETSLSKRRDHPIGRPLRLEGGEHLGDRRAHLLVGINHRAPLIIVDVADRQHET